MPVPTQSALEWACLWRCLMNCWRHASVIALSVAGLLGGQLGAQAPATKELGTINFPTSAKAAAQAPFLTGVKGLYNFEFDIAAEAFVRRRRPTPASRSRTGARR